MCVFSDTPLKMKMKRKNHLPAPSKGCQLNQLNSKGWWIDTLKRNHLAPKLEGPGNWTGKSSSKPLCFCPKDPDSSKAQLFWGPNPSYAGSNKPLHRRVQSLILRVASKCSNFYGVAGGGGDPRGCGFGASKRSTRLGCRSDQWWLGTAFWRMDIQNG